MIFRTRRPVIGRRPQILVDAMHATRPLAALSLFLLFNEPMSAAEAPPGASSCTGCHAVNARINTAVPRLNGRKAEDIITAMAAFKSGARAATVMDRVSKGFSDDETRAIAVWFATQK